MGYREDIVSYCRENLGCRYDYTPSGGIEGESYNCSFLSTCAYKAAGLDIPSWQGHQNGNGSQSDWVRWAGHWTSDMSELEPGDLVFFSNDVYDPDPYDTGHVGVVSRAGQRPYIIDSTPSRGVAERLLPLGAGFCGGGWPFKWLPEELGKLMEDGMNLIISIVGKNTVVWLCNDKVHDLTHPDDIVVLDRMWAAGHNGDNMPRAQLDPDWYARLVQSCKGGLPKHLEEFNNKFKPRS